jgi:hypothetical protein
MIYGRSVWLNLYCLYTCVSLANVSCEGKFAFAFRTVRVRPTSRNSDAASVFADRGFPGANVSSGSLRRNLSADKQSLWAGNQRQSQNDDDEQEDERDLSEAEWGDDLLEQRLKRDAATNDNRPSYNIEYDQDNKDWWLGMDKTNDNDDMALQTVPLFTGIVILLGSLYVTAYGIYVGLYGFPAETGEGLSALPRIF